MTTRKIGIIMNGVTGRMGANQHLTRSIAEIIRQGGAASGPGETILPDPVLAGRNREKLEALARGFGIQKITTNLDEALADPANTVYFDAQTTRLRAGAVRKAIRAGKHIYCEKPVAETAAEALELHRLCREAGLKNGVVQDKLWLPGLVKLRRLIESGFFGRILSARGEFGYWVFEGRGVPAQRPSWNYRKEDGGGIITDMFCHWYYVLKNLFGDVKSVCCLGATHIPERLDENGRPYRCTADDAAYAIFEIEGGAVAQFNSSWCARVRRDDLLTIQVDGTKGSAVAGLRQCWTQARAATPKAVWNPDIVQPLNFRDGWEEVPDRETCDNAFKVQWELFLKHVAADKPFPWTLLEGARGLQLAEAALRSWQTRAWVEMPR